MNEQRSSAVGIAGVTGKFAGLILDHLLEDPHVHVRGYCHTASKLANRFLDSLQLEVIEGNAEDPETLHRFVQGLDVVICAYLGDNNFMVSAQKALIDACDQARVTRYIASDYCLDYSRLNLGDHPAKDPMKIIYDYVQRKEHVQGVHILIGAFMETFWSKYFGIWNSEDRALVYWGTGHEQWEFTTYGDAAQFTAAVALDSRAIGLQKFLGDKQSIRGVSKAFEETFGFSPTLRCQGSLDDLYHHMQALHSKDPTRPQLWLHLFYQYYCTNGQTYIADQLQNARYPHVHPSTFHDFLRAHMLEDLPFSMERLGSRSSDGNTE